MRHINLLCIVFFVSTYLNGLQPLPQSFDEFVCVVVSTEKQIEFRRFYYETLEQSKYLLNEVQRKKQLAKYKDEAFQALQVHHPKWAHEVKPTVSNNFERSTANGKLHNNFLINYGMYLTFVRQQATQKTSIMAKMRTKTDALKTRVTGWFERRKKNSSPAGEQKVTKG